MRRLDESTCSRASARARPRSRRRSPHGSRGAGGRSSRRARRARRAPPDPVADERAPRALREPLDERQLGDAVDDVVEGVVRLHPLDEERRVARGLLRACARNSSVRSAKRCSAASSSARSAAVICGVATSVASDSSSARTRNASRSSCARDRADADAAVRLERDEPERREAAQRLAHGRAADVEALRERLLTQHGARLDHPPDDLVLEHAGDVVGLGRECRHRATSVRRPPNVAVFGSENELLAVCALIGRT